MQLDVSRALQESWSKVLGWVEATIQHFPNIVAAVVVLVLAWIVARAVRVAVRRVLRRFTDHGPVRSLVSTVAFLAILGAGLFVALGLLELDKTVTSLLAGVGILGLALGFAFQDIAENFISGVILGIRQPFTDGDLIETGDHFGVVEDVNLRTTIIRTPSGQLVRIPNANVLGEALVNYTFSGMRRVDLACGVTYADDLERAEEVALDAIRGLEGCLEGREPELFWEEFGGSSINFVVRFWIAFGASQADYLAARSRAVVALKKAFDGAGVGIPFPITTLDFGDVGGRRLREEIEGLRGLIAGRDEDAS